METFFIFPFQFLSSFANEVFFMLEPFEPLKLDLRDTLLGLALFFLPFSDYSSSYISSSLSILDISLFYPPYHLGLSSSLTPVCSYFLISKSLSNLVYDSIIIYSCFFSVSFSRNFSSYKVLFFLNSFILFL